LKIAHLSDNHIGYLQYRLVERKKDFLAAFEKAIDKCIENGVDIIIHTGDLFENYLPDMASFSAVIKVLQKVKSKGIEFLAITGNHDRALRSGVLPPHKVLEDLGLLKLLNIRMGVPIREQLFIDGEILIAGFQYLPQRLFKEFKEEVFPRLSEIAAGFKHSILMFHQGMKQYLPYEDSFEMDFGDLPENFSYYAGGHVHAFVKERLKGGIFSYAGATEFRSRREIRKGNRGFNIFDTENKSLERVELEGLRPFIVVNCNEEDAEEKLKEVLERAEDSKTPPVTLINYSFKTKDIDHLKPMLEKLEKVSLTVKITKSRREIEKEISIKENKNFAEFLEEFLKSKHAPLEAVSLAKEILNASSEEIEEILKEFAGTKIEGFKQFLEDTF